jgi:hypothetical protein
MRVARQIAIATVTCLVAVPAHAAATVAPVVPAPNGRALWLLQARAADAIGEVLMNAGERAEAEVDLMRHALADASKKLPNTTTSTKPPATRETQVAYRALFDQVLADVHRADGAGGAGGVDSTLENLPDGQLFNEMAALQSYNLRTFRRLGELREQAAELRRRLEAAGRWKGDVTTRPAIASSDDLARQAVAAMKREQRSPRWIAARQKMRNALATARSQSAQSAMPTPTSPHTPPANGAVLDDPRWQRYYYGPGDQFGGWGGDATYGDAFDFRGGGGVYERADTRVNTDYDIRTRGQSDRRVNVQFDRRVNTHVDPRQNF